MPAVHPPKAEPFLVEIALSIEPGGYLRQLQETEFSGMKRTDAGQPSCASPELRWDAPPHRNVDASVIGCLADFAARCEAADAILGFEMPQEKVGLQPFDYMNLDEMSGDGKHRAYDEGRESHAWMLYLSEEGSTVVVFHHGKFGMRKQTFAILSEAMHCLRALVDGHPWENFGDEESRRTLLHKGQFFWDTPLAETPIPVDNFVVETEDGHSWCIAGCGGQSVLSWEAPDGRKAYRWNDDHAQSLDALAAILAGELSAQAFHAEETEEPEFCLAKGEELTAEETAKNTADFEVSRWIPATVAPVTASAQGTIFVLSIFKSNDKFPVDSLVFRTKQGHKVELAMDASLWTVTAQDLDGSEAVATANVSDKPAAFRALARALRGQAWDEHAAGQGPAIAGVLAR